MAKKYNCEINGIKYYRIYRKVGENADGKSVRKNFYGDGKVDAEEQYQEYVKDLEKAPNADRNNSLGMVAKYYTYNIMIHESLAPGTIELYERQYRTKLAPSLLAIRPAKEIGSADIQEYLNLLALGKLDGKEINVSQGAIKNLVKYLRKLFKYLSSEGYCGDIMSNVIIPQKDKPQNTADMDDDLTTKDIQIFNDIEVKNILTTPNRKHFLFVLALSTGLRVGELLGLKYSDFSDGKVRVNKQLNCHYKIDADGHREYVKEIRKPKSEDSVRTVPLPENVQTALKVHEIWQKEEMMRCEYRTEYLFTSESGQFLDKGNIRVAWIRHLKRAGVKYKKFHCCRSTYCTTLCKRGVPLETASKLMGHASVEVTAEFYRFIGKSEMEDTASKINDIFAL